MSQAFLTLSLFDLFQVEFEISPTNTTTTKFSEHLDIFFGQYLFQLQLGKKKKWYVKIEIMCWSSEAAGVNTLWMTKQRREDESSGGAGWFSLALLPKALAGLVGL